MKHIASSSIYWYLVGVLLNQSALCAMDAHNTLSILHPPLIELIFENIENVKDRIVFALTCKTYFASYTRIKNTKDSKKQQRWLMNPWQPEPMDNDLRVFAMRNIKEMQRIANLEPKDAITYWQKSIKRSDREMYWDDCSPHWKTEIDPRLFNVDYSAVTPAWEDLQKRCRSQGLNEQEPLALPIIHFDLCVDLKSNQLKWKYQVIADTESCDDLKLTDEKQNNS